METDLSTGREGTAAAGKPEASVPAAPEWAYGLPRAGVRHKTRTGANALHSSFRFEVTDLFK